MLIVSCQRDRKRLCFHHWIVSYRRVRVNVKQRTNVNSTRHLTYLHLLPNSVTLMKIDSSHHHQQQRRRHQAPGSGDITLSSACNAPLQHQIGGERIRVGIWDGANAAAAAAAAVASQHMYRHKDDLFWTGRSNLHKRSTLDVMLRVYEMLTMFWIFFWQNNISVYLFKLLQLKIGAKIFLYKKIDI